MVEHVFCGMWLSLSPYLLGLLREPRTGRDVFVLLGTTVCVVEGQWKRGERLGIKGRCPYMALCVCTHLCVYVRFVARGPRFRVKRFVCVCVVFPGMNICTLVE